MRKIPVVTLIKKLDELQRTKLVKFDISAQNFAITWVQHGLDMLSVFSMLGAFNLFLILRQCNHIRQ